MASYRTCPRYIMPIHILTKVGDDWAKASKVIELTRPILDNFYNFKGDNS